MQTDTATRATGATERIGSKRDFAPWADPAGQPLVRFRSISKRFGTFTALDAVSLNIYEHEFLALLGPSGCGKSTLLRILAGLETPTEGGVELAGTDITDVPPYRRPVNMMFQNYALFPHLTVAGNIAFGLKQDGLGKAEIAARIDEMLALVRLPHHADRKPHQLSGGQRQRVALARSLAKHPKVLLLDEPLAALDRKLREETRFELVELQRRIGTTFVMVTHDQDEAMGLADRIAVMNHGRLVQVGTPAEIYERPASRYVADFVGDVNLIEGTVTALAPAAVIDAGSVHVHAPTITGLTVGQNVTVAIRPERLRFVDGPTQRENILAGTVADVAYLGDVLLYRIRSDDGRVLKATMPNVAGAARTAALGARVHVAWPADAAIVLTE